MSELYNGTIESYYEQDPKAVDPGNVTRYASWACSCGASLDGFPSHITAENSLDAHLRSHSLPMHPPPRAHEESLSVPDDSADDAPTNDVQSPHPPDDNASQDAQTNSIFVFASGHRSGKTLAMFRQHRWELFTDEELSDLALCLTDKQLPQDARAIQAQIQIEQANRP